MRCWLPSVVLEFWLAALGSDWLLLHRDVVTPLSLNDHLALMTLAFVCMAAAGGFFFLGRKWMAVAAFPVTGPKDVIADHPIGALDTDLRSACLRALTMSREACRNFALARSWENSARQFIGNLTALQPSRSLRPARHAPARSAVQG